MVQFPHYHHGCPCAWVKRGASEVQRTHENHPGEEDTSKQKPALPKNATYHPQNPELNKTTKIPPKVGPKTCKMIISESNGSDCVAP